MAWDKAPTAEVELATLLLGQNNSAKHVNEGGLRHVPVMCILVTQPEILKENLIMHFIVQQGVDSLSTE